MTNQQKGDEISDYEEGEEAGNDTLQADTEKNNMSYTKRRKPNKQRTGLGRKWRRKRRKSQKSNSEKVNC